MWLTSESLLKPKSTALRPFTFLLLAMTFSFASLRTNLQIMAFGLLEATRRWNPMYNVYITKRRSPPYISTARHFNGRACLYAITYSWVSFRWSTAMFFNEVYITIEFNTCRIGSGHQHGSHDVMWKVVTYFYLSNWHFPLYSTYTTYNLLQRNKHFKQAEKIHIRRGKELNPDR